jgi:hypothetical protein
VSVGALNNHFNKHTILKTEKKRIYHFINQLMPAKTEATTDQNPKYHHNPKSPKTITAKRTHDPKCHHDQISLH